VKDRKDFREFVFRATGKDTEYQPMSVIDAVDNITEELARLQALIDLMIAELEDEGRGTLSGAGLILKDIHDRMKEVMKAARDVKKG
jgi:hypothetical protein